jgi:hypothetical protein
VLEAYYGLNSALYPWEERIGVVATPEPTDEPGAEPEATVEP